MESPKSILNRLIKESPIPVYRKSLYNFWRYYKKYNYSLEYSLKVPQDCEAALYNLTKEAAELIRKPQRFILIHPKITIVNAVFSCLHELGHVNCIFNNCHCVEGNGNLHCKTREYHANKYALQTIVKNKWMHILSEAMDQFDRWAYWKYPFMKPMTKTKLWKDALKLRNSR